MDTTDKASAEVKNETARAKPRSKSNDTGIEAKEDDFALSSASSDSFGINYICPQAREASKTSAGINDDSRASEEPASLFTTKKANKSVSFASSPSSQSDRGSFDVANAACKHIHTIARSSKKTSKKKKDKKLKREKNELAEVCSLSPRSMFSATVLGPINSNTGLQSDKKTSKTKKDKKTKREKKELAEVCSLSPRSMFSATVLGPINSNTELKSGKKTSNNKKHKRAKPGKNKLAEVCSLSPRSMFSATVLGPINSNAGLQSNSASPLVDDSDVFVVREGDGFENKIVSTSRSSDASGDIGAEVFIKVHNKDTRSDKKTTKRKRDKGQKREKTQLDEVSSLSPRSTFSTPVLDPIKSNPSGLQLIGDGPNCVFVSSAQELKQTAVKDPATIIEDTANTEVRQHLTKKHTMPFPACFKTTSLAVAKFCLELDRPCILLPEMDKKSGSIKCLSEAIRERDEQRKRKLKKTKQLVVVEKDEGSDCEYLYTRSLTVAEFCVILDRSCVITLAIEDNYREEKLQEFLLKMEKLDSEVISFFEEKSKNTFNNLKNEAQYCNGDEEIAGEEEASWKYKTVNETEFTPHAPDGPKPSFVRRRIKLRHLSSVEQQSVQEKLSRKEFQVPKAPHVQKSNDNHKSERRHFK